MVELLHSSLVPSVKFSPKQPGIALAIFSEPSHRMSAPKNPQAPAHIWLKEYRVMSLIALVPLSIVFKAVKYEVPSHTSLGWVHPHTLCRGSLVVSEKPAWKRRKKISGVRSVASSRRSSAT